MASYVVNDYVAITGILGVSRTSDTALNGGYSFNSINPDVVFSYSPTQKLSFYGEVYGQSQFTIEQGAGFNFDAGVLFLIHPNAVCSFSIGQQLYNYFGNFTHYVNFSFEALL